MAFISQFNEFGDNLYEQANKLETSMEQLSDGIFPSYFLGRGKTCDSTVIKTKPEGEEYKILQCSTTDKGYYCRVIVTYPIEIVTMEMLHAVHYDNIKINHPTGGEIFARTKSSQEIVSLHCKDTRALHAICSTYSIPLPCKKLLDGTEIEQIIQNCNFTIDPQFPPFEYIYKGGILIQGDTFSNVKGNKVNNKPPYALYSPTEVTVTFDNEMIVVQPTEDIA